MADSPDSTEVAEALQVSIGLVVRRLRQVQGDDDLTMPESSVLAKLARGGAATATALARLEQISPQSMGATLAALEARGLIDRRPDPDDGRRAVISVTEAGLQARGQRRDARLGQLTLALSATFTEQELGQLMAAAPLLERLAQNL